MDIRLSEEQRMLSDVAGSLAADVAGTWQLGRDPDAAPSGAPDADTWRTVAEAGLLGLRLGDDDNSVGGSCLDVCLVVEQFGRHAAPAPLVGTALVLEQLRCHGARAEVLRDVAAGRLRLAPALDERLGAFAAHPSRAVAFDAAGAEGAVVVGDTAAEVFRIADERGIDVTRPFAGLGVTAGSRRSVPLGDPHPESAGARATAFALAVLGADLLGAMDGAFHAAVAHARVRNQFGHPVASFQAVQHLAAEALVSIEASRSAMWYAAWAVDHLPVPEMLVAARTAKAFCSSAAVDVIETAVQILGGIGMTWEHPAHVWLRRAHTDRQVLGTEHAQYAALADVEFSGSAATIDTARGE